MLCLPALAGCVMFEVSVTNPVAGLTTVAIAPFFNLSEEPTVDGRRFSQAYYAELQKTPGFEVIPVGVVEQVIHDHRLEMTSEQDALKLAEILQVDAVVIGSVTDYSPYYPPRIGMAVRWYSPYPWNFVPGVPVDDMGREMAVPKKFGKRTKVRTCEGPCPPMDAVPAGSVIRGQTAEASAGWWSRWVSGSSGVVTSETPAPSSTSSPTTITQGAVFDPRQPLMSYTRMFDGADPKLTARLRDYCELSGDLRSGGWEAYLHRSEDFIRFTSHVMIVEMLQVHGGEAKRRIVLKRRRHW